MPVTPKHRVIIDTDPGVDDVLALLLALSASPEDLEVVLISVTYGNVPLQGCLRNAVALFHVLEKELAWRRENGRPEG
ncbi:inosine-uridine preferring nucleoside hydrolase, partial [Magnaporthiopsis poae ATCC 64411]